MLFFPNKSIKLGRIHPEKKKSHQTTDTVCLSLTVVLDFISTWLNCIDRSAPHPWNTHTKKKKVRKKEGKSEAIWAFVAVAFYFHKILFFFQTYNLQIQNKI